MTTRVDNGVRRRGRRRIAAALVAVVVGGCQVFVPTDEVQCGSDAQCNARGGAFAGTVCVDSLCVAKGDRCIGHVPVAVEDQSVPLHSRLRFTDLGGTPLKGVPVLACAYLDESCQSPIGNAVNTDADGYAYMTVWKNFRGTIQVTNPPTTADYLKAKLHFLGELTTDDPPDRQIPPSQSVRLFTKTLFNLQLAAHATVDPNAGQVIATSSDCDLNPRPGIHIAATTQPGSPLQFYFTADGFITPTATETATGGIFGVANVPEGPMEIEATIASTGQHFAHVAIWVNKDTVSDFTVAPTPNP